ncbi:MAG TPA: M20 family metallopeptidase [Usitatibacteraceae bacterium]|nr:M20 family metallopeptidase [Usitatibacteraceae bacterium]
MNRPASREAAIAAAQHHFDSRAFHADLARRVAMPTESQNAERGATLMAYLTDELAVAFGAMGFTTQMVDGAPGKPPFLIAARIEDQSRPTVLGYGHGDVIRGLDSEWRAGLSPWVLTEEGDRLYGRGTADNKGQHSINLAALAAVLQTRGRLGFNVKFLIEVGEEIGSPGLAEVCRAHREALRADVFIASDGPRLHPERPTLFLGSRGVKNFDLVLDLRPGAHHSGNWGGLIADPGIRLAHAIASITDRRGAIRVAQWRPAPIADSVRRALADCEPGGGEDGPAVDPDWGEPGLTPAERVFGWSSFAVLAARVGNPAHPVNAIAGKAWARCQLRFVVGIDAEDIVPALRRHLAREGFADIAVVETGDEVMRATRLDPDTPWVRWAVAGIARTTGKKPAILPNLGGSLPNEVFSEILGLPTLWIPHSYAACSQHAPNEHMLAHTAREGLAIMAGLYFDLGESDVPR